MDALSACTRIAARQHGVVSRRQAIDAGLSSNAIDRFLWSGVWTKLHPRVYAPWVAEDAWLQRLMAGTLWLGAGSGVSHRAAAALRELDGVDSAPLEFSTHGRCRSSSPTFLVHHVGGLLETDLELHRNIPITSVTRTLIDLGAVVPARDLELAIESALRRGLTSLHLVRHRLEQMSPHSPHVRVLRDLVDETPLVATDSALEALVWRLLIDHGLEPPGRQHEILGPDGHLVARVDFAYPHLRIAIEADGYAFHSSKGEWQRDRSRQNALTAMGWTVYRVTWADVTRHPQAVAKAIASLIAARQDSLDRFNT